MAPQESSAAMVTTLLNSLLYARRPKPLTPIDILRTDPTGQWFAATRPDEGRGLDLEVLGLVTLRAFWASGLRQVSVDASPCSVGSFSEMLASFRFALSQSAQNPAQIFVILHKVDAQGIAESTLAAEFDGKRDRVLLFSPRPTVPFWTWCPVKDLLRQMQTPACLAARGCGYLTIRLGR